MYFIVALAIFLAPSLVVYFSLRKRINNLENKIQNISASPHVSSVYKKETVESVVSLPQTEEVALRSEPKVPTSTRTPDEAGIDWLQRFFEWAKEDWLLKLGAFLLLIGMGWFASLAFANNWIGPMGRIALGILGGVVVLFVGEWRIKKYIQQGSVFLVVGSTIILLTIYAARFVYDFFSPLTALIVMFLSIAYVALASIRYKRRPLALASLLLAAVAPILTSSPDPSVAGLFSYLLVITLGTLWVVAISGWRILTPAALVVVFLYSLPFFSYIASGEKDMGLLFSFIFTAVFFTFNTLVILKSNEKKLPVEDLYTGAFVGIFLLVWVLTAAMPEWQSLILVVWMLVFSVGAYFIFHITRRLEPFYVYSAVTVGLIAAATAIELSGPTLIIAFTLEAAALTAISFYLLKNIQIAEKLSVLLLAPIVFSFQSIISLNWKRGVLHDDFSVLALLMITLFSLGLWFYSLRTRLGLSGDSTVVRVLLIGGVLYGLILLWLVPHSLLLRNPDLATMISLIIYTVIGLAIHITGKFEQQRPLIIAGGLLLGFVVGRLLVIDIWQMDLTGRVITFLLIGVLLMGTAFIGRKKNATIEMNNENV